MKKRSKWIAGGTVAVLVIAVSAVSAQGLFSNKQLKTATSKVVQENGKTVKEFEITAKQAKHELKKGVELEAYTYNGTVPGSQIRVTEGDHVRIKFKNELPESTSIHWHGVPVPNAMDGVPGVTMNALKRGNPSPMNSMRPCPEPICTIPTKTVRIKSIKACMER